MIWLGYPEESTEKKTPGAFEDAKKAIEEVTLANERIDDCEGELDNALSTLDSALRCAEKNEWITLMGLEGVTPEANWGEIGTVFRGMYSSGDIEGEQKTEAFCIECREWVPAGSAGCSVHGPGEHIVPIHYVERLEQMLGKIESSGETWHYGSGKVPFGRFDHSLSGKVEAVLGDGNCGGILRDFEMEIGKVIDGMNRLGSAMEEMRRDGEDTGGASSDAKDIVKGLRSLKINTVDNVVMNGKRWLVEHRIPGRSGVDSGIPATIIQDMGRMPMRITFRGVLTGDGTMDEKDRPGYAVTDRKVTEKLELLKWFYRKRVPLFFACNFLNRADLATKVLMEDLRFEEEQMVNHQVSFRCTLVEYSDVHWESPNCGDEMKGIREGVEIWAQYQTLGIATDYRKKYSGDAVTKAVTGAVSGRTLK